MANNIDIKDAAGITVSTKTTDNAGVHTVHHNIDTVLPGTGASSLGKAEDSVHTTADVGVFVLAVRHDTPTAGLGADGDYAALGLSSGGRLWTSATIDAALPAGTNNIGDVDILTIAAGDNNIGNVDIVTLPSIPAGNNNIGDVDIASIAAGDNNIGNVDVVTLPALPAGSNNIGDVDVLSVVPGTDATSLGKAEDAVHSSGDVGVMALFVRQNSQSDLAADGDYLPGTIDDSGGLRVSIVAGGGTGGTALADGAAFTGGTTSITPIGGVYQATPDTITDGDAAAILIDASRRVVIAPSPADATHGAVDGVNVFLFNSSGSQIDNFGGGTQYTEDAAAAADPVGGALLMVRQDTLSGSTVSADGDNIAARAASTGAQYVEITAGTTKLGNSTDGLLVNLGTNNDVTVTGNITTVSTVTSVTAIGTSVTPGTSATHLGKAEDAAHTTGDTGVAVWAVRNDTAASSGANGDYVTINSDGVGALWTHDIASLVDDAAFTPATSRVVPMGAFADETATDSVDEGDIGAPRMTLNRILLVNPRPNAAMGATPFRNIDVDETEDAISATACTLTSLTLINRTNGLLYVKLYNDTVANVTVGTTTPTITIPVPGNNDTDGAGIAVDVGTFGWVFSTALTIAATTGLADNDTGTLGANDIIAFGAYSA